MKRFFHNRHIKKDGSYLPGCIISIVIFGILVFLAIMMVLTSFTQKKPNEIQIARVGNWHYWQVQINPYQQWYGLFETKDGDFTLEKVKLDIQNVRDPGIDFNQEKTGKKVTIDDRRSPIILVAGIESIKEGEIIGRNHHRVIMAPDKRIEIELLGNCYLLDSFGLSDHTGAADTENQFHDYGIRLIHNNTSQYILKDHYFYGNGPSLLWSGDMDNDGQIDLLIDCIFEDTSTNMALFLSSLSGDNEFLKMAAIWKSE